MLAMHETEMSDLVRYTTLSFKCLGLAVSGSPFATHNIMLARFLVTAIQIQAFSVQAQLN